MARFGMSSQEQMSKPGPKPIDIAVLTAWEFEWWKAFHSLRDGKQVPSSTNQPDTLEPEKAKKRMEVIKKLPAEKILGRKLPKGPRQSVWEDFAELHRAQEIQNVLGMLPEEVYERLERREIWSALWRARTLAALEDACQRWERLVLEEIRKQLEGAPDDRHRAKIKARMIPEFAAHIRAESKRFLAMTRNKRFPRSDYADDSRLDYLARGMAGIMAGISPMTAIERLRNMKHEPGGPLWVERECWTEADGSRKEGPLLEPSSQYCNCWRCRLRM